MDNIKVVEVKRKKGGQAQLVRIRAGVTLISFVFIEGKAIEMSRLRIASAGTRPESLHLPPATYKSVLRTAYAIFNGKKKDS